MTSRTAGSVFALSTVGNVGGALLTTFVLLRFLGTAAATIVLVAALCLAALAAHRRTVPAAALFAVTLFPGLDLWIEATEYVERIEQTLCEAGETRVLVLGAAGMTLGRGAPCELEVAFVDIDSAQRRITGLFLGAPIETSGTFAAADARAFLRDDPGGWPAIVVDTYSNPRILPQHLLTVEFYRLARAARRSGRAVREPPGLAGRHAVPDQGGADPAVRVRRLLELASGSSRGADRSGPLPRVMCSTAAARASTTATRRSIPTPCRGPT